MNPFLGRRAFPGPTITVDGAGAVFAGEATFDGCIAFTNWPRLVVEASLLPAELELAANVSRARELHPVVFIFGDQRQGSWLWAGVTLPVGMEYPEFAMAVPFVKHRGTRLLHTYIARMYSGNRVAAWDGNVRYGFSKETAAMYWRHSTFIATANDGRLLFHAQLDESRSWSTAADAPEPFGAVREVFAMPVLGRKANGAYVSAYFGWDFDGAEVSPADCLVSIDAPLLPGLEPGFFHDADRGTFDVRGMKWKLSWPFAPRF